MNENECLVDKSQRMYGIVPVIARKVCHSNGLDLEGYLLSNGTDAGVSLNQLHHDVGSWTESMESQPETFAKTIGRSR